MNHALGKNSGKTKTRHKHHFQKISNKTFHGKVKARNEHKLSKTEVNVNDNEDDFIDKSINL